MTPLEIGLHALKAVPKSKGGRGNKSGLKQYAQQIGKTHQYLSQIHAAAEVASSGEPASQLAGLQEKAQHLAAIHKAPKAAWPLLVESLIEKSWTVKDTKAVVDDIRELAIPASWGKLFLGLEKVQGTHRNPFVPWIPLWASRWRSRLR